MKLVRYSYPGYRNLAVAPSNFQRSPWAGFETEIDRLFETALANFGGAAATSRFPVDLYEDQNNSYVRAELPGVDRADIGVEVVDGYLNITASRKTPATEGQAEASFSLSRTVNVSDAVQADKITAAYENGILTVTLPKREEVKPKKVVVEIK